MEFDFDIMTLSELAAYLKLAEKTVLRLVHRREIPSFKVASQWRFKRSLIDEWMMTKIQGMPSSDLARLIESDHENVPLSRLINKDTIIMDLRPGSKEDVLRQLIQPLIRESAIAIEDDYLKMLLDRERMASTALSMGVAIPHIRNPRENPSGGPYLTIGICRGGTDFQALDGAPTFLFILLCAERETVHLRIMAKITLFLRRQSIIKKLISAGTEEEILSLFLHEERLNIFDSDNSVDDET
ncbi:MAG TPA: PTS sugar transporter subunit IIA [Spirochaetia bacterium]|nr:PTS sugar transporter subunit IIA [Spirochaetia bacterium]